MIDMNNLSKISNNEKNLQVIKKYVSKNQYGESIGKICSSFYYVNKDQLIENVAKDLEKNENIISLGIVDENNIPVGIITRRELFDVLGRKYGRDIFMYKKISVLSREVRIFEDDKNILSILNEIENILYDYNVSYFILVNYEKIFAGIFSTSDILIFLSKITKTEIELAAKLQNNIVKNEKIYEEDKISITGYSRMAKGVGGDYYSIINYSNDKWILSLCDVTGKGISSALISALIGGMFTAFDLNNGLDNFILKLNNYIKDTFALEKYLTGIFLDLNLENGEIKIYDMGHSYFYLHRENKLYRVSLKKNIPVGIKNINKLKENKFKLISGDRIFLFSDGLTDQRNSIGNFFDFNIVKKTILKNKNIPLEQLKDIIIIEIDEFRDDYPQFDDITLIFFEYK